MNGVEPVIPIHHFHRVLIDVASATQDLDGQAVRPGAMLGWPALDYRCQEIQQHMRLLAFFLRGRSLLVFRQFGTQQAQGIGAFCISLLGQQHTPHIGVLYDIYRRRQGILAGRQAPLWTLPGVIQGVLVTT